MLTLLTPTGARPQAFLLCQKMMLEQTYSGPVHWVIVDDGPMSQSSHTVKRGWTVDVVRPEKLWNGSQNTQRRNLALGMAAIGPLAQVVVIEDDDYYSPGYLAAVAEWLKTDTLVGEANARYYNVATRRYGLCLNKRHASLCSTAFSGEALRTFRKIVSGAQEQFIDISLWKESKLTGRLYETELVVGIKGLPGRGGIGVGHTADFGEPDPDGSVLRKWVGDEFASTYRGMTP